MFSTSFLISGVAVPLVVACLLVVVWPSARRDSRCVGGAAMGLALALGYWLITPPDDLVPSRNFQWLPCLVVASGLIGPAVVAPGIMRVERWLLSALAVLGASAFLVPTWDELWPVRPVSMLLLAGLVTLLAALLNALRQRTPVRTMSIGMAGSALFTAGLIAAMVSLKMGEGSLMCAAALSGALIALAIRPSGSALQGLLLPYSFAMTGWSAIAAVEPSEPMWALLLAPAAPLALWLAAVGPVSRFSPGKRFVVSAVLVLAVLAGLSVWAWRSVEPVADAGW